MRFKGLDLNLLVALDVLLEEGSVSAAGKRLFLSQSATSGALARLREHFCDELLIPVGRRMVPTPYAQELIDPLRALMLQIDATVGPGQAFDPSTTRRLFRIGCSDYITEVVISRLTPVLASQAPGMIIDVVAPGNDPAAGLDTGEIDILIMPETYRSQKHPSEKLYDENHLIAAWTGNTLLSDGRLDLDRFRTLGHVVARFARFRASSIAETWLDSHVPDRRIEMIVPAFMHVPKLLIGTQRVALVHGRLGRMSAEVMPIRLFDPPFDLPILTEVVQYHRARQTDGGLRWLIDAIHNCAKAL